MLVDADGDWLVVRGDDEEAAAAEVASRPDGRHAGVGFIYVDASLGVDVDMDTGEGESG